MIQPEKSSDDWIYEPPYPFENVGKHLATWGDDGQLNFHIVRLLDNKIREFSSRGYEWKFGREQEFILTPKGTPSAEFIDNKRKLLTDLYRSQHHDDPEIEQKALRINSFTPQELCVLELHLNLADILEPRFAESFYDVQPGVMEVSTKPADPLSDAKNNHILQHELCRLAKEYRCSLAIAKRDVTFSISDKHTGQQLFDTRPGHQDHRGLDVTDGVLRVVRDSMPCFFKKTWLDKYGAGQNLSVGYGRHNTLRWRKSDNNAYMIELRTNHNPFAGSHPALENLLILAGAEYGLYHKEKGHYRAEVSKSTYAQKKIFSSEESGLFFFLEILNASSINETGNIHLQEDLLFKYRAYLEKELDIKDWQEAKKWLSSLWITKNDLGFGEVNKFCNDPEHLTALLKKVRHHVTIHKISNEEGYQVDFISFDDRTTPSYDCIKEMAGSHALADTLGTVFLRDLLESMSKSVDQPTPDVMPSSWFRG